MGLISKEKISKGGGLSLRSWDWFYHSFLFCFSVLWLRAIDLFFCIVADLVSWPTSEVWFIAFLASPGVSSSGALRQFQTFLSRGRREAGSSVVCRSPLPFCKMRINLMASTIIVIITICHRHTCCFSWAELQVCWQFRALPAELLNNDTNYL